MRLIAGAVLSLGLTCISPADAAVRSWADEQNAERTSVFDSPEFREAVFEDVAERFWKVSAGLSFAQAYLKRVVQGLGALDVSKLRAGGAHLFNSLDALDDLLFEFRVPNDFDRKTGIGTSDSAYLANYLRRLCELDGMLHDLDYGRKNWLLGKVPAEEDVLEFAKVLQSSATYYLGKGQVKAHAEIMNAVWDHIAKSGF